MINRAELVLDQVYSSTTFDELFNVPGALYLDIKDTSGAYIPVPCDFSMDALQNNFSSIGGNARQVKDAEGNTIYRYTFNISRYIQSIVTKRNPNAVIRVRAPYYIQNTKTYLDRCNQLISPFTYGMNFIANGRVKLHGTDGTTSALRLNIVYSKL